MQLKRGFENGRVGLTYKDYDNYMYLPRQVPVGCWNLMFLLLYNICTLDKQNIKEIYLYARYLSCSCNYCVLIRLCARNAIMIKIISYTLVYLFIKIKSACHRHFITTKYNFELRDKTNAHFII